MYKDIKIINQNNEGEGIAKINNKVVFIPYALKNDIIDLEIIKNNKNFDIGKIVNINKSSNERREVICPYYYNCGGCNIMHQLYNYQLEFKKNKIINNLKHIADIDINNIDIEYDNEYYYRNHITLSVSGDKIGFLKTNSNDIVNIDKCMISNDIINDKINEIRIFLNKYKDNNIDKISIKSYKEILINIESNNFNLKDEFIKYVKCDSLYLNNKLIYGKDKIDVDFGKHKFKISNRSFFQKNTNVAIKLYDYIKDNVDTNTNVLDLYCGIGSIGIYIANKAKSVLGIEIIEDAVKDAKNNAILNNIDNIKFISGKVEDNISNIDNIDTIIVDPPRVGINKNAINDIIKINPNKIVYVSCNSTTLARDINYLKEYYSIKKIKAFDMFPNTYHCESVCILERR